MTAPARPDRDVAAPRLELRIEQGRARVGLGAAPLGDGLSLLDLEMEVTGPAPAVDPGAGTAPFRDLPCALVRLEVASDDPDEVALPEAGALADLVRRALAPVGWPTPDLAGLHHVATREGRLARATWERPGDEARELLARAAVARERGEPDAALRLALAGQAALAAGLPVEGEAALRSALALGLERDEARDAWAALVALAAEHGDAGAERDALEGLQRISPTGERPALLLRLARLAADAGDLASARRHAEEGRSLAPRDPAATAACLELARAAGDGEAVVDLLARIAALDPASAGERLLEQARLLAAARRHDAADAAYAEASSRLPAQRALADEHAAFREAAPPPVGALPWSAPLETFASRTQDAGEATRALRDAVAVALRQGDRDAALRAARRAHARAGDPSFAGEPLAALLHAGGSVQEALEVHRAVLAAGQPPLEPEVEAERLVSLAELSEESGDRDGATAALDRLLELRPHDADLLAWRFRADPDRARAVARLAEGAGALRSRRRKVSLLLAAAAAARSELSDASQAAAHLSGARAAAEGIAALEAEVARADAASWDALEAAALARGDAGAPLLAEVLAARAASAEGPARAAHLVALARVRRGPLGDDAGALEALHAALRASPGDPSAEAELERVLAATGRLAELGQSILDRAARASDPEERARLRLRAAEVLSDAGDDATRALAAPALLAILAEPPGPRATLLEAVGRLVALGHGAACAPALLALCRADPFDAGAARALAKALANDPAARAAAFREVAEATPPGPIRAGHLREAAAAHAETGDVAARNEAARAAFEAWPADDLAFRGALADVSGDVDATDAILTLRATAVPAEAAACHRARGDLLGSAGRTEDTARAYEACLAADPDDAAARDGLARTRGTAGAPGASIADLLRPLLASARALADAGELGAAYARLKLAREIDPDHLELTLGLARVAEKLGHLDEAIALGEAWADAVAPANPSGAAARYRELADTARVRLSDPDRATSLLEKAAALEPADAATAAALASLRATRRDRALGLLDEHLARLRESPGDLRAARAVAVLSRELAPGEETRRAREGHATRAAAADAIARFLQRTGPAPATIDLAFRVDASLRARVAAPGADGATARLLSLLAPYLEPLFPVDLARFGVGPSDRLAPANGGPFPAALEDATRALGGRPLALFAGRRPGAYLALENTRPPSLVLGPDLAALPPGAASFLAGRAVALASYCWALVGKFAPRDLAILCELASRFAGGKPPSRGLPLDRAGAFVAALERSVPPSLRDAVAALGPASAEELGALDPAALATALERTANRLALVHAGDLHGALAALARLQRPGGAPPVDPAATLERPDVADLAGFALSDAFLDLRGMLLGWS